MTQTKLEKTTVLVEGAMMISLAYILSFIQVVKFPAGGSITVLSMLPIVFFALRRGPVAGFGASFVYAILQLLQGLMEGILSWGLTPGILVIVFFLDYLVPFTLLGVAGFFNNKKFSTVIAGAVTALALRFLCHYASGVFVWKSVGELFGWTFNTPWLYSLIYNGAYMVPEMIFTTIGALYLFKVPYMRKLVGLAE